MALTFEGADGVCTVGVCAAAVHFAFVLVETSQSVSVESGPTIAAISIVLVLAVNTVGIRVTVVESERTLVVIFARESVSFPRLPADTFETSNRVRAVGVHIARFKKANNRFYYYHF